MGQGFALSIKERRRELGLTQVALAAAAGVSLRTVKGWESGQTNPSYDALGKLAAALQVNLDQLVA